MWCLACMWGYQDRPRRVGPWQHERLYSWHARRVSNHALSGYCQAPPRSSRSLGASGVSAAQDVTATSGFCIAYCAWHTYYVQSGLPIKFAFVGNGARCPSACAPFSPGPNNNQGADGMASTLVRGSRSKVFQCVQSNIVCLTWCLKRLACL